MLKRSWSAEKIRQSIPWLRRENALGREILIRPAETRYVLLDDVNSYAVERMKRDGLSPALVVETSPGNLQVWLKLPYVVREAERTAIGRELAARYGADAGAVDWRRFGKLPGFTNRKPVHEYESGGRRLAPFVLLREAAGVIVERGHDLIEWARRQLASSVALAPSIRHQVGQAPARSDTEAEYRRLAIDEAVRMQMRGEQIDRSRLDFCVSQRLLMDGHDREAVIEALKASPHVEGRQQAGAEDYARRTAERAAESDRVQGRGGPGLSR